MHFMKQLFLFTQNHLMQLRRKWLSLPLLFIFPAVIVGLAAVIIITLFSPSEQDPIKIGLVDHDQSSETKLVTQLIEESSQLGSYLTIQNMTENDSKNAITKNEISSYLIFPENFTNHLYQGESVELPIVGNPDQPIESYMINELIESVTRHIGASQANILTINYYAKDLGMEDEARNDFVYQQFQEFLFYALGREQVINQKEISNMATSSPLSYFFLGGWYIITTVWMLSIYQLLTKENPVRLKSRMRLYGVIDLHQILAKILVTLATCSLFSILSLSFLSSVFEADIVLQDYVRISLVTVLYSSCFLLSLGILESLFDSQRIRLLAQSLLTIITLLLSGSIVPVIYYPLWIQELLPYLFFHEGLYWLQEIILHDRLYADFTPLLLMNAAVFLILCGISLWKERAAI
ncbi:ABC transporter permease [Oceanobacillus massiliensis]|uniref:ABC transporter permease n=2 Tax=Oceanobacillus massiliensis TaxID=1465765 RepID=UPI000287DA05|nr:ABC transporter permease [Oceanobacillus massiliensis]